MKKSEIPYYSEIKKLKLMIDKLSNPTSITFLEFNKFKKLYGNMLKGTKVNGFPSPNSFKYPIQSDVLASRPAIKKLPLPKLSENQNNLENTLQISNVRPPILPKI